MLLNVKVDENTEKKQGLSGDLSYKRLPARQMSRAAFLSSVRKSAWSGSLSSSSETRGRPLKQPYVSFQANLFSVWDYVRGHIV